MDVYSKITDVLPKGTTLCLSAFDQKQNYRLAMNEEVVFPLASFSKLIVPIVARDLTELPDDLVYRTISKHCRDSFSEICDRVNLCEVNLYLKKRNYNLQIHSDNSDMEKNIGDVASVLQFMQDFLTNHNSDDVIIQAMQDQEDNDGFRWRGCDGVDRWIHMTGGLDRVCNDAGVMTIGVHSMICIGSIISSSPSLQWSELELGMSRVGEIILAHYQQHLGIGR